MYVTTYVTTLHGIVTFNRVCYNAIMIKISQCMIAKNEEKNIEKALACLKDIVFEQIVVDTGSTDRTIEIAEKMGAKVYNFKWCDDFSAAKNFAIEKATGDWILFMDADEYFLPEDAGKILKFVKQITNLQATKPSSTPQNPLHPPLAGSFLCVNLDETGRPMTQASIVRLFRNDPTIRYQGRIHEQLGINHSDITATDEIAFMHTGYDEKVFRARKKTKRNIDLLRKELKNDPQNLTLKAYLADALSTSDDKKNQNEAEKLFLEVLDSERALDVSSVLRVKGYIFLISKRISESDGSDDDKGEMMCRKALEAFPLALDFGYLLSKVLTMKGRHEEAWEMLKACESKLISGEGGEDYDDDASIMITADPTTLFCQMIITAVGLGDIESVVLYSMHVLSIDKTRVTILGPCIANMVNQNVSCEEIFDVLSNIYDFKNSDDVNIVVAAAKAAGAIKFAEFVLGMETSSGKR